MELILSPTGMDIYSSSDVIVEIDIFSTTFNERKTSEFSNNYSSAIVQFQVVFPSQCISL